MFVYIFLSCKCFDFSRCF